MAESQSGARVELAGDGASTAATGLPVLDHLIGELARAGRLRVALEVAPGSSDETVVAAGRALGAELAVLLARPGTATLGWAIAPADEALAAASLERDETPRLVTNVDLSEQRVGGVASDVASRFLRELADTAGLNLHVRLLEATEPQHVLAAIFKAVGAALGQACRTDPKEDT